MKIGLLASYRGQKHYEKEHRGLISHLEKRGHQVVHSLETKLDHLLKLSYVQREAIFMKFYQQLEDCDLIIAECSVQSTQVGFGLSYLRLKGKPTLILSIRGVAPEFAAPGEVYSQVENLAVFEYTLESIGSILDEALLFMEPNIDKRFTMIFPAKLLAKVEEVAKKKKLPKAVYIRQLIENDLKEENK